MPYVEGGSAPDPMPDALADLDRQRARIVWSLAIGAVVLVAAAAVLGDVERAAPVLAVILIPSGVVAVRRYLALGRERAERLGSPEA